MRGAKVRERYRKKIVGCWVWVGGFWFWGAKKLEAKRFPKKAKGRDSQERPTKQRFPFGEKGAQWI